MESVLTTNNGQANWIKLDTFGLSSRRSFIGWNRYQGVNSAVHKIDLATGMRVMLIPASIPRSERAVRVPGKRGRPCKVGCVQQFEPQKRGRKPMQGPIMFREPLKRGRKPFTAEQKAERDAIKAELAGLIFFGPLRKRGPKPMDPALKAAQTGMVTTEPAKKRGRLNEKERIAAANVGDRVKATGGGYWNIIAKGLGSYVSA